MLLAFAVMHLNSINFFIAFVHTSVCVSKNLVWINRRRDPRYWRVLALCVLFFNRGKSEGTNSSNLCLMFVCVCFDFIQNICVRTDFVESVCRITERQTEVCF